MNAATWVVLADAASARLYELDGPGGNWTLVAELSHPQSRAKPSEVGRDEPGRVKQSAGSRAAMEPPTPYKKKEAEKFAREIAAKLDEGLVRKAYERLVLVTPPAFLGVLRSTLPDRVAHRVAATVEKDYLHLPETELRERLHGQLHGAPA